MKLVEKALLYRQRAAAVPVTWASYVTALALPAWWRMRDTSGVTVVNSGSLGSAVNLTATAWTMAQAGQLGAGEAGLADGTNTLLTCANNATLAGYTTWEYGFLVKPSGAGESAAGRLFAWGNGLSDAVSTAGIKNGTLVLQCHVYNTTPTAFETVTSTGVSTSIFTLIFIAYDNAGDRKIHIRHSAGGSVLEYGYSAQPALTGTYKTPTQAFNLLNYTAQIVTFAGLCDEAFIIGGRTFTDAERLQMTILAGL